MSQQEARPQEARSEKEQLKEHILAERREIMTAMERERGTKIITMVHRREPWEDEASKQSITLEDTESILISIRETPPDVPIDMIVHTPGGHALAAEMIAKAFKDHPAKVTVMIPLYAMSGGTLIALAADEIRLERYSVLGPVDPQVKGMPSGSLIALIETKPLQAIGDQTLILADLAQKSMNKVRRFVTWLLQDRLGSDRASQVADFLTGGYVTHDTPIFFDVAQELGLNVVEGVPQAVYDFLHTCDLSSEDRPCLGAYKDTV